MTDEPAAPPEGGRWTFPGKARFEGRRFDNRANYVDALFGEDANFRGVIFTKEAEFRGAIFHGDSIFAQATFTERADFRNAIFYDLADFTNATFTKYADFTGAKFIKEANFSGVTFTEDTHFTSATFTKDADFTSIIFTNDVNFNGATFAEVANFRNATFKRLAGFMNCKAKSATIFEAASFEWLPPFFDGAKLHEATTWFDVRWPRSPRSIDNARPAVRAYERLKLEMDKLKKHEDELNFFALELDARRMLTGKWSPQGIFTCLYRCLCDYGRSYIRPLWLLGAIAVLGAVPFCLLHFGLPGWRGSLALSAANTFGILGLRKDFFEAAVIHDLPWLLKLLAAGQTVAGAILLFLFGLALRNRFRMR